MVATMEQNFGVTIDYWALTTFWGFTDMINAVGGLTVDVPFPMVDSYSRSDFEPGVQKFTGPEALAFSRDRHSLQQGDFGRQENGGRLIALGARAVQEGVPCRTRPVSSRGSAPACATSRPRSRWRRSWRLAFTASTVPPTKVQNVVLPGGTGMIGGISVVTLDMARARAIVADAKQGRRAPQEERAAEPHRRTSDLRVRRGTAAGSHDDPAGRPRPTSTRRAKISRSPSPSRSRSRGSSSGSRTRSCPHPLEAFLFGLAIVGAAFMLSWAAEVAQLDISAGLAIAILALIAVLPEYAVDFVFASKGGESFAQTAARPVSRSTAARESPCSLALANMTGANRLLIGIGWSMVVFIAYYRLRKKGIARDRARAAAGRACVSTASTRSRSRSSPSPRSTR